MRTFLRALNRVKLRCKRKFQHPLEPIRGSPVLSEPQSPKQRFYLASLQQSLKKPPSVKEKHVLTSYCQQPLLQANSFEDNDGAIILRKTFTSKLIAGNKDIRHIASAKRCKNLFGNGKLFESTLNDIHYRTDAINVELNKRKHRLKEVLHGQKEKLNETINSHRKDFRATVRMRRKQLQVAVAERKASICDTEEKLVQRSKILFQDTKDKMKEAIGNVTEKENIYTIPNLLGVTRVAFSPYLGYLIVTNNYEYALGFMVVASASDFLDGWIARNFKNQSSKIGSFIDPMADKVLIGTLFLTLTYVHLIPVPLTVLIVARDVLLVAAGFVIRFKSLPPPRTLSRYFDASHATAQLAPTFISKVNTGIQLLLVGSTLAAPVFDYVDHPALLGLCYVTALTTVISAASYLIRRDTYRFLRNEK